MSATKSSAKYRFETRVPFASRKNIQRDRSKCHIIDRTRPAVALVHDDSHRLTDDELGRGLIHRVTG